MDSQSRGLDMLRNVDVRVSVELGRTQMKLRDVLNLAASSVVPLDRLTDELLDIMVNGQRIARGEIVTAGNRFALRIVEMGGGEEGVSPAASEPTPSNAGNSR